MTRMLLPARRRQRSCGTASKAESIVPVSVCPFVCLSLAATARRRTRKAYNVGLVSVCLSVRPSGPRQRRAYRHRCGVRLLVCLSRRDADSAAAARRRRRKASFRCPSVCLSVCLTCFSVRLSVPVRRRQRICGTASKAQSVVPVSVCLSRAAAARRRRRVRR